MLQTMQCRMHSTEHDSVCSCQASTAVFTGRVITVKITLLKMHADMSRTISTWLFKSSNIRRPLDLTLAWPSTRWVRTGFIGWDRFKNPTLTLSPLLAKWQPRLADNATPRQPSIQVTCIASAKWCVSRRLRLPGTPAANGTSLTLPAQDYSPSNSHKERQWPMDHSTIQQYCVDIIQSRILAQDQDHLDDLIN
jgi:hypothetical protein